MKPTAGVALGATALLAAGGACLAAGPADVPDEVVITARLRREALRDVPLAVQVLAGDALREGGADDLASMANQVPGLYFESGWGGQLAAPTLRGQAQPSQAGDNVGVFIDGVYQANAGAVDTSLLDIERVEVISGPQSALFGRSTFAGALSFVSREPGTRARLAVKGESGTAGYRALSLVSSGWLPTPAVRSSLALAASRSAGAYANRAAPGARLGGTRKGGASLALAAAPLEGLDVTLRARVAHAEFEQPPIASLAGQDFNCGSRDPASGFWSYYCGPLPTTTGFALTPGIPPSRNLAWQVSLAATWQSGAWQLESLGAYNRGRSTAYRDFDATAQGSTFGVCTIGANCAGSGGASRILTRFAQVNQVTREEQDAAELGQDLRLRWHAQRHELLLGMHAHWHSNDSQSALGAGPNPLLPGERLTALLPATPMLAGPGSQLNRFLVADPNATQLPRSAVRLDRRAAALYGGFDQSLPARMRLHLELRVEREYGRDRCSLPGCTGELGTVGFSSATPRISLDMQPRPGMLVWLSAARGTRGGGSNDDPTLIPSEQQYGPESNWTWELGYRGPLASDRLSLDASAYYIDWRNTQILGPSNSPGNHGFVMRNLQGIRSYGFEAGPRARLADNLSLDLRVAYQHARFAAGSEDVGSSGYCGITLVIGTSSFCTIGPTRNQANGQGQDVPYVDGRPLMRAPAWQWGSSLTYAWPASLSAWHPRLRAAVNHQGDVYARAVGGARYGGRTLLDAQLSASRGPWTLNLHGKNLGNERYVRIVASRGPAFFPTTPRPLDLVMGDGRELGLALQWQH